MFVIGIIFVLAAGIWWAVLLKQFGLVAGCLSVVLVGSCFGHAFFHVSLITLDRLLWALVIVGCLLQRWRGAVPAKPWNTCDAWFVGFLTILAFNTFTHDFTADGAQPLSRLLFLYLMPAGLYWVARQQKFTTLTVQQLAFVLAAFALYLSLTAIAEVSKLRAIVLPTYIASKSFPEFLGRGRGPFLNPSANGIYIGTGLGCWWMFWFRLGHHGRKILALGSLIFCLGALATLTRCVWMGIALSAVLLVALNLPRRQQIGISILICTIALTGLAVGGKHLVAFKRDENVSVSDMAESAKLRPMLALVAWEMFRDYPLMGVGFGQYKQADRDYIAARTSDLPLDKIRPYHQHNVVLSLLTETGLLGTIPFLALFVVWARTAFRLWHRTTLEPWIRATSLIFLICLINYLANGMFQDVALIPMVNLLLFFLAGVLVSVASDAGVTVSVHWPARWRQAAHRILLRSSSSSVPT
jgi:O-antigen ligase